MDKKGSRKLVLGLVLTVTLGLLFPAYGKAAEGKSIELKFASISAPNHVLNTDMHRPWIKQIEEATKGRVKITLYPGGTLGTAKMGYDIAVKSIADISYGWINYHPGRFPLSEVYQLPGVMPNIKTAFHLFDIYEKYLKREWAEAKLLWLAAAPPFDIFMADKQIRKIEDIKGLKIGCQGGSPAKVISAVGGVPVDIPAQEAYTSLQRRVIDGIINVWSSMAANKLGEVTKYYTNAGLYSYIFFCVMNHDSYNSLPADIKKIIDQYSDRKMWETAAKVYWTAEEPKKEEVMRQSGGKGIIYDLPAAEVAKYRKIVTPLANDWIKNVEAKGQPGKQLFEAVMQSIEE